MRASKLKRSFDYSPDSNFCSYSNRRKGPKQRSVEVDWGDLQNEPAVYEGFRDHRYRGCAKGPAIPGADKTCWDHGKLVLFGKEQIAHLGVCSQASCALHTAAVKARMGTLLVKMFSRFP